MNGIETVVGKGRQNDTHISYKYYSIFRVLVLSLKDYQYSKMVYSDALWSSGKVSDKWLRMIKYTKNSMTMTLEEGHIVSHKLGPGLKHTSARTVADWESDESRFGIHGWFFCVLTRLKFMANLEILFPNSSYAFF